MMADARTGLTFMVGVVSSIALSGEDAAWAL
jgi:hypothetical protein